MFSGCNILQDEVMIDNQVLITYITDTLGGNVGAEYAEPYGQGRIRIINDEETADTDNKKGSPDTGISDVAMVIAVMSVSAAVAFVSRNRKR